jgi:hypothetical protein
MARPGALQEEQDVVVVAVQPAKPTQAQAGKEFAGGCGLEEAHWVSVVVSYHVKVATSSAEVLQVEVFEILCQA